MASAEESREDVILSEEQVDALTQLGDQPDDNNDDQKLPANDNTNLKVDTTNDNKVSKSNNTKKSKLCTVENCTNKQVKGGVCQRHGARVSFHKCTQVSLIVHMIYVL